MGAADDHRSPLSATSPRPPKALASILRQRCPVCRRGPVFRRHIKMYETCPVCDHRFEREPGYFVGAMYVSYALGVPIYLALAFLMQEVFPNLSVIGVILASLPFFLPLAPFLFRYARVIWLHLDWAPDPER